MMSPTKHPYAALLPDLVLGAVESLGLPADGRLLALNSYENRVYRVGLEDRPAVVAKFYRPGRWSDEAIHEEHAFSRQLAEAGLPVVPPLSLRPAPGVKETTLHDFGGFRFALFPLRGGRWRELEAADDLRWMGRFIARIHAIGRLEDFHHRPRLDVETLGEAARAFLRAGGFIPSELEAAYDAIVTDCLEAVRAAFARAGHWRAIRLHGDCHLGNVLWDDEGPHFVDLDDCLMGPAIQDLWMLLSGDRDDRQRQLAAVLDGYEEFLDLDYREIGLVEALRTLRMLNYSAWLARRWDDPAFPRNFPWFNTRRYWEEQVLALKEQLAALTEPPLVRRH